MLQFLEKITVKKVSIYIFKDEQDNTVQLTAKQLKELILSGYNIPGFKIDTIGRIAYSGESLDNKEFGDWKVLYRLDGTHVRCLCKLCNTEHEVTISNMKSGKSTCCKNCRTHKQKDNIEGKKFGHWNVIKHIGRSRYLCKCDCNNETERIIQASLLKSGVTKSCGCISSAFKDITGETFGRWVVTEYLGNGYWKCQCQCENKTERNIYGGKLRACKTLSCGCLKEENRVKSLLNKYGETSTHHINKPREQWQIEALQDKHKLSSIIKDGETIISLSNKLNISYSYTEKLIHKYKLENSINMNESQSEYEKEILEFVKEIYNNEVITKCRSIITPYELDIYLPDRKLAIEFNGSYWHSTLKKSKNYHQDKTIDCAKQGIRLIHIFEHEWINNKEKLKSFLKDTISINKIKVAARNVNVKAVNLSNEREFLDRYHLQGYTQSSICLGCYYNNELISLISFRKPRFNNNYEYEIVRYCNKNGYAIVGGLEKMFKRFIEQYSPQSIITYSDISKFTGNCYRKIGFKPVHPNPITEPNYVWVSADKKNILSRYQTQKHKLINNELGTNDETEDDIMTSLNFLKVYDSGNIKLEYIT